MHSRSLAWDTAEASAQYRQIVRSGETAELAIEKRIVVLKCPDCTLSHMTWIRRLRSEIAKAGAAISSRCLLMVA